MFFKTPNFYIYFSCSIFVCGALLYGYDATYFAGVQAMGAFLEDFGNTTVKGKPALTDTIRSLYASMIQVGEMLGCVAACFIGNKLGRRNGYIIACVIVCLGAILQTVSKVTGVFMLGRTILGIGIGIISNVVPLYLSEVPPTHLRGAFVGSWQFCLDFGKVIGACIVQGTHSIPNSASYRIPIMLHCVLPAVVFATIAFIPESPRWLVRKDEHDKAAKALSKLHKGDPNYDPTNDLFEMEADVAHEISIKADWRDLYRDPVERRKLYCTFGILTGQQITGIQFVSSYSTTFIENVGLSDGFVISIIIYVIEVVGAFIALFLVDKYGRRPLLLPTVGLMVIQMFIIGCLDIKHPRSVGANNGIVSMIILFVFFFCLASGPLAWVVATESCVGRNRSLIMMIGTFGFWLMAWAVTFTLPYMYTAMGPKLCFIYCGLCAVYFVFIYFEIGETVGKSMEEINLLFERRVPPREWKNYQFDDVDERSVVEESKEDYQPKTSHEEVVQDV